MSLISESLLPEAIDADEFANLLEHRELLEATELAGRFGHCQWNSQTRELESCSRGYARLFEMSPREALEKLRHWDALMTHIHPDDRARYAEAHDTNRSAGNYTIDYRIILASGEVRWVHEVTIMNAGGARESGPAFSILQDITEQVETEQKLRNSDDLARQIEMASDIGYFIFDEENDCYAYVSPGYARIHGLTQAEYMARGDTLDEDLMFVHEDDRERVSAELKQYSRTDGKDYISEYRIVRIDGEVAWVREKSVKRMTINNRVIQTIGVMQDITATKKHEQEMREARESLEYMVSERTRQLADMVARLQRENIEREAIASELERKNAELERFAYTVSHDLKTPLVTINGLLGLITKDLLAGDGDSAIQYIEKVNQATGGMARMLEDLLELSRVGHVIGQSTRCDPAALARLAIESFGERIDGGGVKIEIEAMPPVDADSERIVEVYQNLIENALKFLGDQEVPEIRIGALERGGRDCYFVADNGIGIAPEYQQKVFGLFERLETNTDGTGIGLALVKRIIEVHNGEVWIESTGPGHGCTVFFTLAPAKAED